MNTNSNINGTTISSTNTNTISNVSLTGGAVGEDVSRGPADGWAGRGAGTAGWRYLQVGAGEQDGAAANTAGGAGGCCS